MVEELTLRPAQLADFAFCQRTYLEPTVVLPPGRASDATGRNSTGLGACMNTIGIVRAGKPREINGLATYGNL
jgi:hypothetical protein